MMTTSTVQCMLQINNGRWCQMTTAELIQEEIRIAGEMAKAPFLIADFSESDRALFRYRCEIRAELNGRHDDTQS